MTESWQKITCIRCGMETVLHEKTDKPYFIFVSPDGMCRPCAMVIGEAEAHRLMMKNIVEKGTALSRFLPFVRKLEQIN